ncbi:MAG TPA: short-chain dehydrogenase [Chitinophagaceae bacterium]|jgi:hypothetical protein|nr:short-chain dehydrogenase [Chitinophagaceae bacterium]
MTTEMIEKFVENKSRKSAAVNIHFKERSSVKGMFIRSVDYDELKRKNLWRVVSDAKIEEWNRTRNMDLPKIFNGLSFTRLTDEE